MRRLFDRRATPIYVMLGLEAAVVAAAVASGRFTLDGALVANLARDLGGFLLIAFAARWIGFDRVALALEWLMLSLTTVFLGAFVSVVFASFPLPLADGWLAAADLALGFRREPVLAVLAGSPALLRAWVWIYESFAFTPQLLAVLLLLAARPARAWTLLVALTAAMLGSMAIMPLVPAHGAPCLSYQWIAVFDGVRDGSLRHLDTSVMTGMVTFPSLHAADAAILVWGYRQLGRLALPFVALNMLMVVSAVVVGGHYLVDLAAGLALAWAAIRLALWCERRFDRAASAVPM
jgi:membrane-associated phospholipid phosphatase